MTSGRNVIKSVFAFIGVVCISVMAVFTWFAFVGQESVLREYSGRRCRACADLIMTWCEGHEDSRFPSAVTSDPRTGQRESWRVVVLRETYGAAYVNRWLADPGSGPDQFCWAESRESCFAAVIGPDTVIREGNPPSRSVVPDQCIVLVEVYKIGIDWSSSLDVSLKDIERSDAKIDEVLGMNPLRGVHVLFADGEIWYLRRDVPLSAVARLCSITGARKESREALLGKFRL